MLGFVSRLALIVGLTATSFWLLGPIYLIMAMLVAISVFAILLTRAWRVHDQLAIPQRDPLDENEVSKVALDFFYRFVLALAIGGLWPGLPIMLWRRVGDRANEPRPTPTNSR